MMKNNRFDARIVKSLAVVAVAALAARGDALGNIGDVRLLVPDRVQAGITGDAQAWTARCHAV